jgi:chaperonin GroEL
MASQIVNIIQDLILQGKKQFVLFANKSEGQALAFLIQNYMQGKFMCVPVKLPSFGDYQKDLMYDLATLVEAKVLGQDEIKKIEDATAEDCGTCEKIIINRESSIITGGKGDVSKRIEETNALLKEEKDVFKKEKLKDRLGRLTGSIANIQVGGASESEQMEIRYRIEDALNATKWAIEEGVVEGGGIALLRCSNFAVEAQDTEFNTGVEIIRKALLTPIKTIVSNGGISGDAVAAKVLESNLGYNALTNKYEDLFVSGIVDPKKVVKTEIINAVATAGILLTSGCAIANKEETK